jgi:hypothetical protein
MIFIAHRGLTEGPDPTLENRPDQILKTLDQGFHCEIDVRYINGQWLLGHDRPDYEVTYEFLEQPGLWIHAKNLEALYVLGANKSLDFFWHQNDDFTLTSRGAIWTFPKRPLTKDSIMLMPEWHDPNFEKLDFNCLGICSDYVKRIKEIYDQRPKSEV